MSSARLADFRLRPGNKIKHIFLKNAVHHSLAEKKIPENNSRVYLIPARDNTTTFVVFKTMAAAEAAAAAVSG